MKFLLVSIWRCPHARTSFPLTPVRKGFRGRTYVSCLDCGKEFEYSWQEMKVGPEIPQEASGASGGLLTRAGSLPGVKL